LIPMLEVDIDLNLRISDFFKEGGPLEERKNPAIKELDIADAIGNAKMVKLFDRPKWAYSDPEISEYFREHARKLVAFKKSGRLASFMEDEKNRTSEVQGRKTKGGGKKAAKLSRANPKSGIKNASSKASQSRRAYWRRQRKSRIRYKKQVITKNSD